MDWLDPALPRPRHGGRIREAARHYGIPPEAWLDLSTGINPHGWAAPAVPAETWHALPEEGDGLVAAARACYRASHVLPVAGSQAAIQALPHLRPPGRVGILTPGYAEHAHAWRRTGHEVVPVTASADRVGEALPTLDVLILIHPNNPTGTRFLRRHLLEWHSRIAARGGWLVLDEAFMDPTPHESLAAQSHLPGLIVLRSLGKFFGLAGARVGFVCAAPPLLERLDALLGPWTLAGPSRWIATKALRDTAWQAGMRVRLHQESRRLASLLTRHGLTPTGGCALFQWVLTPQAPAWEEALARRGILVRRFDTPASLRFGLPGQDREWERLDQALEKIRREVSCLPVP
ncbi:MAG: threonine-phosphate decarboxylase [Gammaproteobacteria bacterium]|nr:MAG: threonine-phosphate decarboxylase [Gammaproteobacteria bacterium]